MKHGGVACCLQLVSTEASAKVSDELQYICTIQNEPTEEIQPLIQELIQEFDHLFSTPTRYHHKGMLIIKFTLCLVLNR
jgi:hypothetical protein